MRRTSFSFANCTEVAGKSNVEQCVSSNVASFLVDEEGEMLFSGWAGKLVDFIALH